MPATPHPPTAWADLEAGIVEAVLGLGDGNSVLVEGPEWSARPARVQRGRLPLLPARRVPVRPWVRLTRMEDLLRGLCLGPEAFGAGFPWTTEEHAALLDLGWHVSIADGQDYVRFWPDDVPRGPYLPREDAERAAAAVARAFREVLAPPLEDERFADLPSITT